MLLGHRGRPTLARFRYERELLVVLAAVVAILRLATEHAKVDAVEELATTAQAGAQDHSAGDHNAKHIVIEAGVNSLSAAALRHAAGAFCSMLRSGTVRKTHWSRRLANYRGATVLAVSVIMVRDL